MTRACLALLALILIGCTGRGGTSTPTPTATVATPSPTATATLPAARPGVPPGVDAIINAVLGRDVAALERLTRLVPLPCGPQQGPGSPPACPAGQPAGTPVEVFPTATCEGELRPASAVRATLEEATRTVRLLTGVYRAPETFLPGAKGEYIAVFSRQVAGQDLGVGVIIGSDRVIGLWFGCGIGPAEIVPPGTPPVYLPGG
jgi:hypothetical protein